MKKRCNHCLAPLGLLRAHAKFCSTKCRVYNWREKFLPPHIMRRRTAWLRLLGLKPVQNNGKPASSTNKHTWQTYFKTRHAKTRTKIGYALGGGIACYTLKHCFRQGKLTLWAQNFLKTLETPPIYAEKHGNTLNVFIEAAETYGYKTARIDYATRFKIIPINLQPYTLKTI